MGNFLLVVRWVWSKPWWWLWWWWWLMLIMMFLWMKVAVLWWLWSGAVGGNVWCESDSHSRTHTRVHLSANDINCQRPNFCSVLLVRNCNAYIRFMNNPAGADASLMLLLFACCCCCFWKKIRRCLFRSYLLAPVFRQWLCIKDVCICIVFEFTFAVHWHLLEFLNVEFWNSFQLSVVFKIFCFGLILFLLSSQSHMHLMHFSHGC